MGIKQAFARYGATLHNVNWSVSAWLPNDDLVVSLWAHHYRPGPDGTMEFAGKMSRWSGAGNAEFRRNVAKAYDKQSSVRLVVVRTEETARVDAGEDASRVPKDFAVRDDVVGKVTKFDGENYVFRFWKWVT